MIHPDLKIVGEEILKTKAEKITIIDQNISNLINKMFMVMEEAGGIGLAANQIGSNLAVFVTNVRDKKEVFINPEIIEKHEPIFFIEGCLSVPGVRDQTKRFNRIVMTYQTPEDMSQTLREEFEKLAAVVMQHETDHLNGALYIDDFSQYRKSMALKKCKKTLNTIR